jgi:hypothetical protein
MEKKTIQDDSSNVPLVRGMGTVKNVQLMDLLPVVNLPGARKYWDSRFLEGDLLERYSRRAYKLYTVQKCVIHIIP